MSILKRNNTVDTINDNETNKASKKELLIKIVLIALGSLMAAIIAIIFVAPIIQKQTLVKEIVQETGAKRKEIVITTSKKMPYFRISNNVDKKTCTLFIDEESDCIEDIIIPNIIDKKIVTQIGDLSNDKIKSIKLSSSVINIKYAAFSKCPNLTTITVDEKNPIYKSDGNCLIEKATNSLVVGCNNSSIPDYITKIEDYAFLNCQQLINVNLPNTLKNIGNSAFEGCTQLNSITFPNSLNKIGKSAFNNTNLINIVIPNSVNTIGKLAFTKNGLIINCEALTAPSGFNEEWYLKANVIVNYGVTQ